MQTQGLKLMKRLVPICLALFFLSNSGFRERLSDEAAQSEILVQLKGEVQYNLTKNILPYWTAKMTDNINGGFFGRIDADEKVYRDAEKGGILNARILWTYSSAYRVLKDPEYLRMATRAKEYILKYFIDNDHGGTYRSLTATGEPSDTRKQIYSQAFFVYALSEYCRATGDKQALQKATEIFECIEKHALDKDLNGYYEVFSRDWTRSPDRLIGEQNASVEKTMNTHLHIMEAYANLYRVWPDERIKERLANLVNIFLNRIIDKDTYHLICFMERDWDPVGSIDSYGHDIEASWLLYEAAHLLGDPKLITRVKDVSLNIADAASEGLMSDGSMLTEKDNTTGHVSTRRSWWEQAETVVGYLNAFELSGDKAYLQKVMNSWDYIKNHFIDHKNGGWHSYVTESGEPGHGDKAGFWICPYHNGRMCLEVIERIK